jgi:PAS domain S-box-containing protein
VDETTARPTDSDQSDEKLKSVVSYLAQGQRLSSTGVWVWNPFTDHHFASAQAYRLFGFTADEATAVTVQDFPLRVHPEDRDRFEGTILQARRQLTDFECGYRVVYADGSVRHMHAIGHPMTASTGEIREFIGTVVDVTERRLAEEAQARQVRDSALRVDVSGVLAKADTVSSMLQGCAEAFVRQLDVAFARIWTLPRGGNVLTLEASAGRYTHLDGAHSRIAIGDLKIGMIAQERRPHLTNDVLNDERVSDKAWAAREGMVAFAGYPLVVSDRVVGVMAMFARQPIAVETLETLGSIADAIAQGIERKRSERRLRRATRQRFEAVLAERTRFARDMHDGLLQDVTGLALQLRAVLPHVASKPDETVATLQRILELAERTSREAREAVVGMRSSAMSTNLAEAVENTAREAARRAPVTVSLTVTGRPRPVRPRLHEAVVAMVREAVTNVVKHAEARSVLLLLAFRSRGCRLSVSDDGKGFATDRLVDGHFGLIGMRERASGCGGSLDVKSVAGRGTVIRLDVPYKPRREPS